MSVPSIAKASITINGTSKLNKEAALPASLFYNIQIPGYIQNKYLLRSKSIHSSTEGLIIAIFFLVIA